MRTLNKTLKGIGKNIKSHSQSSGGLVVVVVPQPRFFDMNSPAVPLFRPTQYFNQLAYNSLNVHNLSSASC